MLPIQTEEKKARSRDSPIAIEENPIIGLDFLFEFSSLIQLDPFKVVFYHLLKANKLSYGFHNLLQVQEYNSDLEVSRKIIPGLEDWPEASLFPLCYVLITRVGIFLVFLATILRR